MDDITAGHGIRRLGLRRPRHRAGTGAEGLLVRVACRRIELAESVKTRGRRRPDHADAGQPAHAASRSAPRSPAARRWSMPSASPSSAAASATRPSMPRAPARSPRRPAPPASQRLVHVSGIGADSRSSSNAYVRSKVAAEDAVIAGFDSATILRPSVVFGPDDALFNRMAGIAAPRRRSCRSSATATARVQPVFVGDVGGRRRRGAGPARHGAGRSSSWAARGSTPTASSPPWC